MYRFAFAERQQCTTFYTLKQKSSSISKEICFYKTMCEAEELIRFHNSVYTNIHANIQIYMHTRINI